MVCEDGSEYLERFTRFLDEEFEFTPAGDAAALVGAIAGATGVILDLDFRRTPPERLVDESGATSGQLAEPERRRLSESQGILILRALRSRKLAVPVLLCADLDEDQVAWLERELAPLEVVPSHEGLLETAARMRALAVRSDLTRDA